MLCETRCSLSHWQGHRLTLLCILDCAAHLLPMPEEVETSFLNQTIKVFTKVSINIRCKLNILRCVFCMHESVSSALSRLTVPQWRTSLCTRPWKQSWLPFFISCVTELWRRATTPDPASTGPLWHEEDSQTGGFCSHFLALLYFKPVPHFRYCCQSFSLSRYAKTVSFEGLAFHFSWKLLIDSKHCHSLC